ncbi:hypothetical protein CLOSCI_00303 [[Clostridium] scindens ATCC 35704]|uniref:Uncharacterized protein n=1 Tax=Clostridium scindens (strain ATCC 35704 / DSM 5676 / VPI 13733 / 19) TaxID=411468 RepID=B0NA36_CLOS5|nr:hypothetical protein [[Clostridium] scindens]EDS08529.1 hypothetical protein CLOSCI_00303 [[Clostridium] scindens ATCC 35704]QBF72970.1 hypothetical protein HDCHBGLK_00316 [[Clostridium] scindens ATCC 35704]QRO36332.1 hypothetical protein I6J57_13860 [[Clostridium] scindens]
MVNGKAKLIFGTGDIMMTPVLHSENNIPQYGMLAFSGGRRIYEECAEISRSKESSCTVDM